MRRPSIVFPFLLVLGLVGLWRGLQWYNDYLTGRWSGRSVPPEKATAAQRQTATAPGLPEPSTRELATLTDLDRSQREFGLAVLQRRSITPELQRAVDQAYDDPSNVFLRPKLACLKARYPGDAGLDFALANVGKSREEFRGLLRDDFVCLVNAVAERGPERPDAAYPILYEAAFSVHFSVREAAIEGLARLPQRPIPAEVRDGSARTASVDSRRIALPVAMALGAIDQAPEIVRDALGDPDVRERVRHALVQSASPTAPRLVAQAVIDQRLAAADVLSPRSADADVARLLVRNNLADREDPYLAALAREREQEKHDISSAFVEIALDQARSKRERQMALEILTSEGDPGAGELLAPLQSDADPEIKAYASAALAAFDRKAPPGHPRRQLPRLTQ